MRLVVLAACNLALFQGVWWIVILPPIAIVAITVNLALYAAWVRRRRMTRPELAAALAGLLAAVAMTYDLMAISQRPRPRLAGRLVAALPEGLAGRLPIPGPSGLWHLEYALLIGLGLLAMLAAARLTRRPRTNGGSASAPSP
jgi:hypothetical protein